MKITPLSKITKLQVDFHTFSHKFCCTFTTLACELLTMFKYFDMMRKNACRA